MKMFPLKTIASGVLLLLLSAAGFIYILARPKPPLKSLPSEPIQLEAASDDENNLPELQQTPTLSTENTTLTPHQSALAVQTPKTFSVRLLSPRMAETFTAAATVDLKAEANPHRGLKSIEFYSSPLSGSLCQSLTTYGSSPGTKLGETFSPPYEFTLSGLTEGIHNFIAVANYESGEKQISPSVAVFVEKPADHENAQLKGWRPRYEEEENAEIDATVTAAPTPTPTLLSCPTITVSTDASSATRTRRISFKATVNGGDLLSDAIYEWKLSAGEIVDGQNTSAIVVSIDPVLDRSIVASVAVGHLHGICPNSASTSVKFDQPRWLDEKTRSRLLEMRKKLANFGTLRTEKEDHGYIVAASDSIGCVDDEILKEARLIRKYLIEMNGLPADQITVVNRRSEPDEAVDLDLIVSKPDDALPHWLKRALSSQRLVPCSRSRANTSWTSNHYRPPINRKCPDLDENISYKTLLHADREEINTCPYNRNDPQNTETQTTLTSSFSGTYSNYPALDYWANAGQVLSSGQSAVWDLSAVKLLPGRYSVIARSDDRCDCDTVSATTIAVTNFCTPCLRLARSCDRDANSSPDSQTFTANVGNFATANHTSYKWSITKGRIVSGQGTARMTVNTSSLQKGEEFVVTVLAGGLQAYCVNELSYKAVAGQPCVQGSKIDEYGVISLESRHARRRPPPTVVVAAPEAEEPLVSSPGEGPERPTEPPLNEKEWMKVSWTAQVKTDDAVEVKVVYNRNTEKVEISNTAGDVTEELKLGKLLKAWFGKDYEVFGDVRLRTAGLRCDSCNQEQYQSFDKEQLEWIWPLKPESKGTQLFSLELWVKGEPRNKQSGKLPLPPEKAWSKSSLKIEVTERVLTKNTVFAGCGLCTVLGFGLCVRGLKVYRVGDTYNVGQAVAVGRNVTMTNTTVNQQTAEKDNHTGDHKDG